MAAKKKHGESEQNGEAESKKKKFDVSKLNYWMVASVVLVVVLIAIVAVNSFSEISKQAAQQKIVDLAAASGLNLSVLAVEDKGSFYQINYSIQGQAGLIDISKDGKYVGQMSAYPETKKTTTTDSSSQNTQTTTVPKSDKPKVELYVWAYCPYGILAQGPMAEVANLLKASADFEIVPYYDGHGAFETQENKIELCVQKLYKDKYWAYAAKFVSTIYPKCSATKTVDCDKTESAKVMSSLGIDSAKVMSCVSTDGDALYTAAQAKAQQNGVTGSPSVVINGVISNAARTADAYKTAVCAAFNNAPSACSSKLNSTAAAASGNCGA